ncbi:MAG: PAS domain-containing sensor histidine kinase [Pedobacter sp.]|nr:PAS domain-containing sensor histidine kinase [Pedobacter sp.]
MNADHSSRNSLSIKVADGITAMLAYWDKDLICRFANSAYLDWFGKTKDEMIDKISIIELLGPLYEKNRPYIERALKGEVQIFEREIPLPFFGTRHSLANYYPDIINGEVAGFIVHVADVNEMKILEMELDKSHRTVSEQNERLLNFSNIVSHNLKSYSNNLTLILDLFTEADSENEKQKMLGLLKGISKQFSATVNHLNEIVKSQNKAKLNSESINIYDYIEKSRQTLQVQISSSNAVVINNVSTDITLIANPAYMESIILNFLTNAIKYRREEVSPVITLDCTREYGRIALIIKDNGKGIDLEKYGNDLFGMYKTFHGNSDAQGIGLFITKYQIETMGGDVKVDSTVGIGTIFTVYFNSA